MHWSTCNTRSIFTVLSSIAKQLREFTRVIWVKVDPHKSGTTTLYKFILIIITIIIKIWEKWVIYAFIGTRPQHGQQVDTGNWRRQVGTHGLDVEEQLSTLHALDHRDPQNSDGHHHAHKYTEHAQLKRINYIEIMFSMVLRRHSCRFGLVGNGVRSHQQS